MKKLILAIVFASFCCISFAQGFFEKSKNEFLSGVNIHFLGGQGDQLDKIKAAGFQFVRVDLFWNLVEREPAQYKWERFDQLINELHDRGMGALVILAYSNPLYAPLGKNGKALPPVTDEQIKAYARWAAAAAKRYEKFDVVWEIWNEPNHKNLWPPVPSAAEYMRLSSAAVSEIRRAAPSAVVVGPGLAGIDLPFLRQMFVLGAANLFDALTLHPYRLPKSIPETAVADYRNVRAILKSGGARADVLPLISGEWGYSSYSLGVSQEEQAEFAVRMFLVNVMAGVRFSVWYDWLDNGTDNNEREHNFGLVKRDGQPKPVFEALQTLNREIAGSRFVARVDLNDPSIFVLQFERPNSKSRPVYAVWSLGPATLDLSKLCSTAEVSSLYGEPTRSTCNRRLQLTGSPIFLEVQ